MAQQDNQFGGLSDPLVMNRISRQIVNTFQSRSLPSRGNRDEELDWRRNINDECGYPETGEVRPRDYKTLYDRMSIATRVVEVMPKESWQVQPSVFEDDDVDTLTEFEQAWIDLGDNFQGPSWFQDEEGSPIWEYILRADINSGISSYGVILLGIDDGKELSEPIDGFEEGEPTERTGGGSERELLFLRVFDESLADITAYENEKTNPRFGKPTKYSLTFDDPRTNTQSGHGTTTEEVHWSRVIHIADNLSSSEIFGVPRMRPVLNRLLDLRKLYGGSAEMYWKGAFPGISWETHPQLGPDVLVDPDDMKDQMEQLANGLQRYTVTEGLSANSLAPQVVDPTPQIEEELQAICILTGIPKRIFVGSERGELASSEDKDTWFKRLGLRQNMYLTPRVIVPFIDRLIQIRVLPEPEGYSVVWPDLDALSAEEKAAIAMKTTESLAKYVGGNVEAMISPADYWQRVQGRTKDEAEAIIDAVMEEEERMTPDETAMAAEEAEKGREFAADGMERGFEREDEKDAKTDKESK